MEIFYFITFPWIVCNFLFIFIFYLWWVIIATIFPVISLSSSWWWWQFPLCRVSDSTWNILYEGDYLFYIVKGWAKHNKNKFLMKNNKFILKNLNIKNYSSPLEDLRASIFLNLPPRGFLRQRYILIWNILFLFLKICCWILLSKKFVSFPIELISNFWMLQSSLHHHFFPSQWWWTRSIRYQ